MARPRKKTSKKEIKADLKDRDKLLSSILDSIDGAQLLGSDGLATKIRGVLSTQSPGLDAAIGRGGIPLGRLSILAGPEGTGKTTFALHLVAECQRRGGVAIYVDKEYKLDPDYARAIGVDTKHLIILQPDYLEKVFEAGEHTIEMAAKHRVDSGVRVPILFVLDSMNAAITKAQFDGEWTDQHYSPQAGVFSQCLPKFIPKVSREDVALLFLGQKRSKIGVMFGDDFNLIGGNAPPHYASLIMRITRIGSEKKDNHLVASKVKIECIKNQISPPFKKTECLIEFGKGVNKEHSLLWHAESLGVVKKNGSWYTFKGKNIGQGLSKTVSLMREDRVLYKKIKKSFRKKAGLI